jgi:hypothetical protein
MPFPTQPSHLCKICFQRYFNPVELQKHYNSSHGDENDFPRNGEDGGSESETEDAEGDEGEERECEAETLDVIFPVR